MSLMNFQMMRVISSPSISTTGFFTLILAMAGGLYHVASSASTPTRQRQPRERDERESATPAATRAAPPPSSRRHPPLPRTRRAVARRPCRRTSSARPCGPSSSRSTPRPCRRGRRRRRRRTARRSCREPRDTTPISAPSRVDVDRAAGVAEARVDAVAARDELAAGRDRRLARRIAACTSASIDRRAWPGASLRVRRRCRPRRSGRSRRRVTCAPASELLRGARRGDRARLRARRVIEHEHADVVAGLPRRIRGRGLDARSTSPPGLA